MKKQRTGPGWACGTELPRLRHGRSPGGALGRRAAPSARAGAHLAPWQAEVWHPTQTAAARTEPRHGAFELPASLPVARQGFRKVRHLFISPST